MSKSELLASRVWDGVSITNVLRKEPSEHYSCVLRWRWGWREWQTVARVEPREAVEVDFKGRRFAGSFTTSSGMVHVISLIGRKSAQLTGVPPVNLARALLHEIVAEAYAAGMLR
jgi:hypothetical protein